MTRHILDAGMAFIKQWEELRLDIYEDATGNPTIGYGHMLMDDEDFSAGITPEKAEDLLREDLKCFEDAICRYIRSFLNDNQFAALCSLCYNVGNKPLFGTLGTLLNLPQPDYANAALEFLKWDKGRINGQLTEIEGLKRRRQAEMGLFNTTPAQE